MHPHPERTKNAVNIRFINVCLETAIYKIINIVAALC